MMVSIGTILYTLYTRIALFLLFCVLALPLLICLLLPQKFLIDNPLFSVIARFFYWFCIKGSLLPISYQGIQNIPNQPSIILANHQSSFDIPLVGYALKKRAHIWTAWAELAKSPLFRWIIPRIAILIDVTSPMRAMRSLIQTSTVIADKPWDLIIFPEGARITDEQIHDFFSGFAFIAKKTNRPVVPIKITGVNKVYPPHTFWIYYYPITVHIGNPFFMEADETEQAFTQRVYQWFIK